MVKKEKAASIGKFFSDIDTSQYTAEELVRLDEVSKLVGDANASQLKQASQFAASADYKNLKRQNPTPKSNAPRFQGPGGQTKARFTRII